MFQVSFLFRKLCIKTTELLATEILTIGEVKHSVLVYMCVILINVNGRYLNPFSSR